MVSPEISRRCLICGASVRAAARFCPQCGAGLAGASKRDTGDSRTKAQTVEPFVVEGSRMPDAVQSHTAFAPATFDQGRMPEASSPIASQEFARMNAQTNAGEQLNRVSDDEDEAFDAKDATGGWRFLIVATALILFFILVFTLHTVLR